MADDSQYDSELQEGSNLLTSDLVKAMRANLQEWISYMEGDPPLAELQARANRIMEDIQSGSGLPGAEDLAIQLALAVDSKFERLGLWRAWYPRLMYLYEPAVERAGELGQANLFQCLMHYYLHRGDMVRASGVINQLLDIAALKPDAPIQEAMLGAASVASVLTDTDDGKVLAEQLLELAALTNNSLLMGRAYGVLNRYYASQHNAERAFEYGQMVYSVGIGLRNDVLILNGLHYMALAFQVAKQPERAFLYLGRLKAYSEASGDVSQMNYLWYTLGACCYLAKDYQQAEQYFRKTLALYPSGTVNHATTLYMLGLALMQLSQFDESEKMLKASLDEWETLKRPFDRLYVKHGLAHLRWMQHRYKEAVRIAEETLAEAEKMDNVRRDQWINELRPDLERYRASLKTAASSEIMLDYIHS